MEARIEKKAEPGRLGNNLGVPGWVWAGRYWVERWGYLAHRVTGLALIAYLVMHVVVTGQRARGPEAWDAAMGLLKNPLFKVGELLVLVAFIVHGLNGLRLIFVELGFFIGKPSPPKYPYKTSIRAQRPLLYVVMLAGAVIIGISIREFFHLF